MVVTSVPGRQRQAGPCGSLASQPSLLDDLQATESTCLRRKGCLRVVFICKHMCTCTHTNVHTNIPTSIQIFFKEI